MRKILLNYLIFAISLGFLSCEKNEIENNKNDIMPIAEGNSWTYNYHYLTDGGTETSTLIIGKYKKIGSHYGFEYGNNLIRSDKDGNTILACAFTETDTIYPETIIYMKNLEVGESFDYHLIVRIEDDNGTETLEESIVKETCINKDTLISVAAGKFNCIVYEYSPDNGVNVFKVYLSTGVGNIKTERFEDGIHFSTTELIDYDLK